MISGLLKRLLSARRAPSRSLAEADSATVASHLQSAQAARSRGDFAAAEATLRQLVSTAPSALAFALLAEFLSSTARPAEALACYERALEIEPTHAQMRFAYAGVLQQIGEREAAEHEYRRLIEQCPDWPLPYVNCGLVALERSAWIDALELLRRAVELDPALIEARVNLARALIEAGRPGEALEHCNEALRLAPQNVPALTNLAGLQHQLGDADSARKTLSTRIVLAPHDGAAIARALALPAILESREHIDRVRARLRDDVQHLLARPLKVDDPVREIGVTHFFLAYHGCNDRDLHEQIARLHLHSCPSLGYVAPHCHGRRRASNRLRIGVLSRFLYNHSIGRVTQGLVERIDKRRFDIRVFTFQPPFDAISRRIAQHAGEIIVLPRVLADSRELIARHELDVLLYPDIGMDPISYFLAFARLAPVQCTTWGHPVTSGIPNIDYFISTDYFEPENGVEHYSEKLVQLKDVAFPGYYEKPEVSAVAGSQSFGTSASRHTFFCPQALFKIHPDFDVFLKEILHRDESGQIVIVGDPKSDFQAAALSARLQKTSADVLDRILFMPRTDTREQYLQRLRSCVVVLDTVHYCGGNTSLEAISAKALVVTLPSGLNRGRHTYGFFRKMRFDSTIVATRTDYVDLAVRIARDSKFRAHLQEVQSQCAGALYSDQSAVTQMESFLTEAVARAHLS